MIGTSDRSEYVRAQETDLGWCSWFTRIAVGSDRSWRLYCSLIFLS